MLSLSAECSEGSNSTVHLNSLFSYPVPSIIIRLFQNFCFNSVHIASKIKVYWNYKRNPKFIFKCITEDDDNLSSFSSLQSGPFRPFKAVMAFQNSGACYTLPTTMFYNSWSISGWQGDLFIIQLQASFFQKIQKLSSGFLCRVLTNQTSLNPEKLC